MLGVNTENSGKLLGLLLSLEKWLLKFFPIQFQGISGFLAQGLHLRILCVGDTGNQFVKIQVLAHSMGSRGIGGGFTEVISKPGWWPAT